MFVKIKQLNDINAQGDFYINAKENPFVTIQLSFTNNTVPSTLPQLTTKNNTDILTVSNGSVILTNAITAVLDEYDNIIIDKNSPTVTYVFISTKHLYFTVSNYNI